jgi:hypothetical protein
MLDRFPVNPVLPTQDVKSAFVRDSEGNLLALNELVASP